MSEKDVRPKGGASLLDFPRFERAISRLDSMNSSEFLAHEVSHIVRFLSATFDVAFGSSVAGASQSQSFMGYVVAAYVVGIGLTNEKKILLVKIIDGKRHYIVRSLGGAMGAVDDVGSDEAGLKRVVKEETVHVSVRYSNSLPPTV